jgi:hypothetical protein
MGNDEIKKDNDNIREIQKGLNELNKLVSKKQDVIETIPELSELQKIQNINLPDIVEDDQFSELVEKVAAAQFTGSKKADILVTFQIDNRQYKEIVTSKEYSEINKRLAEDQRTYLLSKVLNQLDTAVDTLANLMEVADEDKVRMQSAALILEHAQEMLKEHRTSAPTIANLVQNAANSENVAQVNIAQFIMASRRERGLS